ncbi:GntR family transcriptional regulator [Amycolatopsis rhizosphaerae]|uniref:GntR family transcriptional regulator n=1 Tax=Amycolatopsis rhizosphaerae TaxID=2053003 RepID=A0A558CSB9_9PSEU|nr:GntR family transcriptional regulator [Amycolatopsis rhizosphaerae]TVT51656.1 GntR family transcriptional regulator [Amycolatopsis rhizosphaerae]
MPAPAGTATSGRDKAYAFLKYSVLADPAMEGAFVSEQAVAERVGVSRTPVREALLQLAAEDLVQLVPNRGAYVAPLSGRDLKDLFELRGVLERFAAQKALTEGSVPANEMEATLARQARHTDREHAKDFIELDHHFHSLLVEAAGNAMLAKTYASLRARQMRAGLTALARSENRQEAVLAEHRRILDALVAGDLEGALAAIDDHHEITLRLQLTAS